MSSLRTLAFSALAFALAALGQLSQAQSSKSSSHSGWVLSWSDEFNGANGSAPDAAKWAIETGGHGWGNGELEYYTSRSQNLHQENGHLVIQAIKERYVGPEGIERNYTSGRLKTAGRFSQQYGRFEARIQIPSGRGVWPAFWLLGEDYPTVGWPACGEIDIMESVGSEPMTIRGTLHGPGYSGGHALTVVHQVAPDHKADSFHIFAVEWQPREIRFYVDDTLFAVKTPADIPAGGRWVFDHPFFIILNLAVGGSMPGNPDDATEFPKRMLVDYVRVYSRK